MLSALRAPPFVLDLPREQWFRIIDAQRLNQRIALERGHPRSSYLEYGESIRDSKAPQIVLG
jgi:hypothetical protein